MHSTTFTAIARAADEVSFEVVAVTESFSTEGVLGKGALVLFNADNGEFAFTKFAHSGEEVEFTGTQYVGRNQSKAYKYLADFTMDARRYVHMEAGYEVENTFGQAAA
jgi:hypothetical protein